MNYTSIQKAFLILAVLLFFFSHFYEIDTFADIDQDQAASALADAETTIISSYQAVVEAEDAGVDVSSLLVKLNEAGANLTHAHIAYRKGDFHETIFCSKLCEDIGREVKEEANKLNSSAQAEGVQNQWFIMTGSIIGVITVFFGGFLVWRIIKKRYYQKILGLNPEINADEP